MDTSHPRAAVKSAAPQVRILSIAVALAACCAGCKSDPVANPFLAGELAAPRVGSALADQVPAATRPLDTRLLADEKWLEKPPASYAKRGESDLRWHHRHLDPYLQPAAPRTDLAGELSSSHPVVAANAAIVSAHWGAATTTEPLAAAVRSDEVPLPLRCAAVQALGLLEDPSPAPTLRLLLEEFAPSERPESSDAQEPLPPEIPDLHAELIRALARRAEPQDEPWFSAALAHPAWQVRLEGVAAWTALVDLSLPPQAVALRADRDPRVRAAALRTIAAHRDPRAVAYLQPALDDQNLDVRVAAMAGLAEIGTTDAKALLGRLKNRGAEFQQAAALAQQAAGALRDDLQATAADAQSQLRQTVAESLDQAEQRGRQLAAETVDDAGQFVRQASAQAELVVADAQAVAETTAARIGEVQQLVASLREADLNEAARRQASMTLERMAMDANLAVRARAARAMGEVADPVFLPALMALLSDEADVQMAAMASLAAIAGQDVTAQQDAGPLSNEERIRLWQLWYRQRDAASSE